MKKNKAKAAIIFTLATISTSGCQFGNALMLDMEASSIQRECTGNPTNSCVNRVITHNIKLIDLYSKGAREKFKEYEESNKGRTQRIPKKYYDTGFDFLEHMKDDLDSKRPFFLFRWFMGDAQSILGGATYTMRIEEIAAAFDEAVIEAMRRDGLTDHQISVILGEITEDTSTQAQDNHIKHPEIATSPSHEQPSEIGTQELTSPSNPQENKITQTVNVNFSARCITENEKLLEIAEEGEKTTYRFSKNGNIEIEIAIDSSKVETHTTTGETFQVHHSIPSRPYRYETSFSYDNVSGELVNGQVQVIRKDEKIALVKCRQML